VAILGGYAGYGTANPDARGVAAYPTILSGDIGTIGNNSDNSYHVVTVGSADVAAVLDGFTVSGGNADGSGDAYSANGGGILVLGNASITNCVISGNTALSGGGGMQIDSGSATLVNCLFTGNSAYSGGGIDSQSSSTLNLTNCTFSANTATQGGALFNSASATATNAIFWNDTAATQGEIDNVGAGAATVAYSDIGTGYAGTGNVNYDPRFTSPNTGNFTLSAVSPVINLGNNVAINATGVTTDLAGNPRIVGGLVDMGAYEFAEAPVFSSANTTNIFRTGGNFTFTVQTYGYPVPVITESGALPSGMTFLDKGNSTATLSGAPAVGTGGNYTITLMASNGILPNAAQIFTFTVNVPPTITSVNQATFTAARYGTFTVTSSGTPTAALSVTGTLPAGLTFADNHDGTGTLSGRATQASAGTYSIYFNGNSGVGPNTFQHFTLTVLPAIPPAPPVVYVDANSPAAPIAQDGTSWATAFSTIQEAQGDAFPGDTIEVAQGTYYPTTTTDRTASFDLVDGQTLEGGFAGAANPTALQNVAAYPTILSGDIGVPGNNADNSYHVVSDVNNNLTASRVPVAVLDGFTITGGNADGGTGFFEDGGSPGEGGGILIENANPTINTCTFAGNSGTYGGAMFVGSFYYNSAPAAPNITNCIFTENSGGHLAGAGGGAIFVGLGNPTISNCSFFGNNSSNFGGAIANEASTSVITNCTFTDNSASFGGAIYDAENREASTLTNCIIWGDGADSEIVDGEYSGVTTITNSDIEGGYPGAGNINAAPQFINAAAGNLQLQPNSPCVDDGSNAAIQATGATTDLAGDPRILDGVVDMGAYELQGRAVSGGPYYAYSSHGVSFPLQGSGFTAGAGPLSYAWTVSNGNGINIQLTGQNAIVSSAGVPQGSYSVQLQLSDPEGNTFYGTTSLTVGPPTLYVDQSATGANDGVDWQDAFTTLSAALSVAHAAPAINTIEVALGTYFPTGGTDRTATFQLLDNVGIYGGYAGDTTNTPGIRNVTAYPTVLSGDIGTAGVSSDNSYHVVTGSGTNSSALLDGFTISGGYADGSGDSTSYDGAGMFDNAGTPTINDCQFSGNQMVAISSLPSYPYGGAGLFIDNASSMIVTNCIFSGNSAYLGRGGGIDAENSTSLTLTNCTFNNNTAYFGGGVDASDPTVTVTNCSFDGNYADEGGGLSFALQSAVLTNCTIAYNSALFGGAIYDDGAAAKITNSIVSSNGSDGIDYIQTGPPTVTNSDIAGGYLGVGNINAGPQFVNAAAGNLQLEPTSPCVNVGSNAAINATGVTTDLAGNPRIVNSVVDMGAYEVQCAVSTWAGLGDGVDWSDPNNWTGQSVPTQGDVVTIPAGFSVVQVPGAGYSAGSVAASSPLEIMSTGSLKLFGSSVLNSPLTIDNGGTLDIQSYSLTINYAAGADPAATIRGYLKSAYAGGVWTGAGLTSSAVEAQVAGAIQNSSAGGGVYSIGYEDGGVDLGQLVAVGNQLIIEPAIVGDTDLNGDTNFLDLGRVAQNLGAINSDWYHGDFNYDGATNFLDIGLLAQNLSKTILNTPLGAEVAVTTAAVSPVATPVANPMQNLLPHVISAAWPAALNLFADANLNDVLR
jgi:hypothetical protein